MSAYVFLGPTLPVDEARRILDAVYLPPAAAGDLCALLHSPAEVTAIGLVDGLFQQQPAIWHKELLFALSRGIPVYGSSSMGALRAAELAAFGMIGVGKVFEAFRDGVYEDDDEVAVIHGLEEHRYLSLSDPMVNLRHGLSLARASAVITAETAERLTLLAKSWFYPERSWKRLFRDGGLSEVELQGLRAFVERERPEIKRDDAEQLLERMKSDGQRRQQPRFDFEPTKYWEALVASRKT
jgi:hypothetical protein